MNLQLRKEELTLVAHQVTDAAKTLYAKNSPASRFVFYSSDGFAADEIAVGFKASFPASAVFSADAGSRSGFLTDGKVDVIESAKLSLLPSANSAVFFFYDALSENKDKLSVRFKGACDYISHNPKTRVIAVSLLPEVPVIPDGITAFAERELEYFVTASGLTPEWENAFYFENLCRDAVKNKNADLTLLRFDNICTADRCRCPSIESINPGKNLITGLCDLPSMAKMLLEALSLLKVGHIYNASAARVSAAFARERIHEALSPDTDLKGGLDLSTAKCYNCLGTFKITAAGVTPMNAAHTFFPLAAYHIGTVPYSSDDNNSFYDGRLPRIQELENEILTEIDRICLKYNISYFLAGGSLLGAVREGGPIPWDDDLDIGMTRDNFEKFRKVCEGELSSRFCYASPFNDSASHYTIDKVRLKNTFFSTELSGRNNCEDGVFVDILIYDKTSNNKLLSKIQTLILSALYDCIILKWRGAPIPGKDFKTTKLLLPFVKLLPFGIYHRLFECTAKWFKNKKDAKYLIDTVGKKLKKGLLPNKGLDSTVRVPFADITAPIPVDCVPYLTYAYGERYMTRPPVDKQASPHTFLRIDLGASLFGSNLTEIRPASRYGELFE